MRSRSFASRAGSTLALLAVFAAGPVLSGCGTMADSVYRMPFPLPGGDGPYSRPGDARSTPEYRRAGADAARYADDAARAARLDSRQRAAVRQVVERRTYDLLRRTSAYDHDAVYPFPRHDRDNRSNVRRWWSDTDRAVERTMTARQRDDYRRWVSGAGGSYGRYDDRYDDRYERDRRYDDRYDDRYERERYRQEQARRAAEIRRDQERYRREAEARRRADERRAAEIRRAEQRREAEARRAAERRAQERREAERRRDARRDDGDRDDRNRTRTGRDDDGDRDDRNRGRSANAGRDDNRGDGNRATNGRPAPRRHGGD